MIIVIADDITGAAELGGIGLQYNLRVLISDDVTTSSQPDLLVIYTNTRSMPKEEALKVVHELTVKAKQLNPQLFYKKTDSVLRGHVLAEMEAQMKVFNVDKGLLVPVNPLLGRTIKDGHYYVNDQPVHETSFSEDPEYPILNSRIEDMMGKAGMSVKIIKKHEPLSSKGVAVGEAQSDNDMACWAKYYDQNILFAGGASFFSALLNEIFPQKNESKFQPVKMASPLLFVSGTTFQKSVEQLNKYPSLVSIMPANVFSDETCEEEDLADWSNDVIGILSKHQKAIIAIGQHPTANSNPNALREKSAEVVKCVFDKVKIHEVIIEGGSTAYSIVQKLGWRFFTPTEELQQGIVRMQVEGAEDVHLTIKPGSYEWPQQWTFD